LGKTLRLIEATSVILGIGLIRLELRLSFGRRKGRKTGEPHQRAAWQQKNGRRRHFFARDEQTRGR
jgi:hypothetical protein